MGEKRKARVSLNERSSKREKKSSTNVTPSASNEEIDEQSSLHSLSDTNETSSQPADNPIIEEVEETAIIEVEVIVEETACLPPTSSTPPPPPVEISMEEPTHLTNPTPINTSTNKSWWSSIARLFHFGWNHNENKTSIESNGDELPSSPFCDGSYLSKVKARRSLHGDTSLVN